MTFEAFSMEDVNIELDSDYQIKTITITNLDKRITTSEAKELLRKLKINLMKKGIECGDFEPKNIQVKPDNEKTNKKVIFKCVYNSVL